MRTPFRNRQEAGKQLAAELAARHYPNPIVLALPRGGVPVAYEIARELHAPLDVCVVRKLGVPGQPELAMGAITHGVTLLDNGLIQALGISQAAVDAAIAAETAELERRERTYRAGAAPLDVGGRTVIIVDDGLATGATMRAAVRAIRALRPARIVAVVPVGAADTCALLRTEADDVVCLATPEPFRAVGLWYSSFPQTSDREVLELLQQQPASDGHGPRTA